MGLKFIHIKNLFIRFRKILLNLSARLIGNTIGKIITFFTIPFISRALGPEGYGDYNLIFTVISYTVLLVNWGFQPFGIRRVAESKTNEEKAQVVNETISARLFFSLISASIAIILFYIIYHNNLSFLLGLYLGLTLVIAQFLNINYYYFGNKDLLIPTIAQNIGQFIFFLSVMVFIKNREQLHLLVIFNVGYQLITSLVMLMFFLRKNKIKLYLSMSKSITLIKQTFKLGLSGKIEQLTSSLPILIIPLFYTTNYELGLYSSGFRFFTIIQFIFYTIMLTMAPYIVSVREKSLKIQRRFFLYLFLGMTATGVFGGAFIYLMSKDITVLVFGNSFIKAVPVIKAICLYMLPIVPTTMYLGNILVYYNLDSYYLKSRIVFLVLMLISVPLFVHLYGIVGAIYALGLSNFAIIITMLIYINKKIPGLLLHNIIKS